MEIYGIKIKENKYLDIEESYMVSPITEEDIARKEAHLKIVSIKGYEQKRKN